MRRGDGRPRIGAFWISALGAHPAPPLGAHPSPVSEAEQADEQAGAGLGNHREAEATAKVPVEVVLINKSRRCPGLLRTGTEGFALVR